MIQKEIHEPGNLLSNEGTLLQRGYSKKGVLTYNREKIKAPPWRVKEWDFYQISNDKVCLQLTIGHVSYAGSISANLFEFETGKKYSITKMLALPFNRLHMPQSAEQGDLMFHRKDFIMKFEVFNGSRRLQVKSSGEKAQKMNIDITLEQPDLSSLVIATPFDEDPSYFYYNHKINCMPARGIARIDDKEYIFDSSTSFGLLDWGRGVWPFQHNWYWGNGSCLVDGKRFGFNIGYGFGNTEAATENMLFYDGTAHKINQVYFNLSENGYMAKKYFSSDDGRFEMEFTPIYDNYTETKLLWVNNRCHQVFGRFNGQVILDDGKIIEIKDMVAFCEHAINRW
ncbi:DUF2804 domain-containing protein [Fredinandcohnia quinoae]|uniref:DUF2804 domain-containing protein n=1 Tax=Fredinandcohnia quinoae TaxID=2918902 RepID=A0AAW5DU20_9BACI|nr:DUF2804 domain-containing protein [Fredinandcohnia sp. SECRCQ15]MCH1624121.1 DUF2804 domain-containing protein [Fredinandcohnia sp. SECRCQ15]